jgi:hypothetical protein
MPTIQLLRPNFTRVDVGPITFWFSYRTCIAFHVDGAALVIRQNDWRQTTGKHLNAVDPDHSIRVSGEEFQARFAEVRFGTSIEVPAIPNAA